jgi:hypothetical protein
VVALASQVLAQRIMMGSVGAGGMNLRPLHHTPPHGFFSQSVLDSKDESHGFQPMLGKAIPVVKICDCNGSYVDGHFFLP